jgi:hypothetical protein
MNVRSLAFAALAVIATSAAIAEAPQPPRPAAKIQPEPVVREQTLLEEVAAGMREILRAVTPDIALPALSIELPTLEIRVR